MNLKETYNKIAEDWHNDHKQDDWWVEGTDKFITLLKSGDEVLDVGCGAGFKSKYLTDKGLKVVGLDISDKLLDIARNEVPNAQFLVMDMNEVENIHKEFDGVFAQASLLHIPKKDVPEVIGKLLSVLKSGGYFYVAVKGIKPNGKEEDILKENDYGYDYERFFSYYKMDELERYFKDWKLNIIFQNTKLVGKTDWLQIIGCKV